MGYRQNMERRSVATSQMGTHNVFRRNIHQIPIIDKPGIPEVQVINPLLKGRISLCVRTDQNKESQQSCFMDGGME
jgi:hypothetical protein